MTTVSIQDAMKLAAQLEQSGRGAEAEEIYRAILRQAPQSAPAMLALSILMLRNGRTDCTPLLGEYIRLQPDDPEGHNCLGIALMGQRQPAAAVESLRRAVALRPGDSGYGNNLGNALLELGRLPEAIEVYRQAIALQPANAEAHYNVANALKAQGRLDEAIAAYEQAIALRPQFMEARNNLAIARDAAGQYEQAIQELRVSASLWPQSAAVQSNLARSLEDSGEFAAAAGHYHRAIELQPDLADAHVNLACNLLRDPGPDGMADGWAEYEWRWRVPGFSAFRPPVSQARWDGSPAPPGATILLHAEQGIGDTIQFLRYVPRVIERGWRVIIECQAPLGRLLRLGAPSLAGLPLVEWTTPTGPGNAAWPPFDVHLPLASLPWRLGEAQPSWPGVYLHADDPDIRRWRDRLERALAPPAGSSVNLPAADAANHTPARRDFRVGLVWAGNPLHRNDRQRSIALQSLAPLAASGAQFVSLQTGPAAEAMAADVSAASASNQPLKIADLSPEIRDLADTAAILASLDLLISVDTAPAHLAGAMGRPCWVLLAAVPDFRWMLNRPGSPWYPSLRLYRQTRRGDWSDPVAQMAQDLTRLVSGQAQDAPLSRRG